MQAPKPVRVVLSENSGMRSFLAQGRHRVPGDVQMPSENRLRVALVSTMQ